MIGKKLGQYKIIRELGSGGMGTVYEAYQESLSRSVAIKMLPAFLARDKELVERFYREAKAAARLSHPGIVQIYNIDEEDGMHYFAMELLKGVNLSEVIRKDGRLTYVRALNITLQVAEALACAHQEGIIHRDIKPGNIMVGSNDRIKVTDFGIARALYTDKMTMTGAVMGTPEYMSPEQARGMKVGPESDIYSLGIVLYEMLSGKVPFHAETPYGIMDQHVHREPPPLRELCPDVPVKVEEMVTCAMSKDPAKRYQNAQEWADEIKSLLSGLTPEKTVIVPSARKASGIKKWALVAVPVAAAAVLVLGGVLIVQHKPGQSPQPSPAVPAEAAVQPQPVQEPPKSEPALPAAEPVKLPVQEEVQTQPQVSASVAPAPAKDAEPQEAAQPSPPKAEPAEVAQPNQADEPEAVAGLPPSEPPQFQPQPWRQKRQPPPPQQMQEGMWQNQPQQQPPPGEQGEYWNQGNQPPPPQQNWGGEGEPQQQPPTGGQPEQWGQKWQPPPEDAYGKPSDGGTSGKGPQDSGQMPGNLPPVRRVPEEFKQIEAGLIKSDPRILELARKGLWKDLKDHIWKEHLDEVDKLGKVIRARREEVLIILAGHLRRRMEMERLYGEQWVGENPPKGPPPQPEEPPDSPSPPQ